MRSSPPPPSNTNSPLLPPIPNTSRPLRHSRSKRSSPSKKHNARAGRAFGRAFQFLLPGLGRIVPDCFLIALRPAQGGRWGNVSSGVKTGVTARLPARTGEQQRRPGVFRADPRRRRNLAMSRLRGFKFQVTSFKLNPVRCGLLNCFRPRHHQPQTSNFKF